MIVGYVNGISPCKIAAYKSVEYVLVDLGAFDVGLYN